MEVSSSLVRSCIRSTPEHKLLVADLSNIEGRFAAWCAGEDWKINAFRDFDKGNGHDLYKIAYANSFDVKPEDVTKDQRAVGKVQELFLQYGGGVGAFLTGASAYNIDLEDMAAAVLPSLPVDIKQSSREYYNKLISDKKYNYDLSEDAFVACNSLKTLWRINHPAIVSFWQDLEASFKKATRVEDKNFKAGPLTFRRTGKWLRVALPSGRQICYASPMVKDDRLSYMGVCSTSRKWKRIETYGGKLFENICQAGSRDVLAYGMMLVHAKPNYDMLLTVHDEIIVEAPDTTQYTVQQLAECMQTQPPWAQDLPLAAEGYESYTYKKG